MSSSSTSPGTRRTTSAFWRRCRSCISRPAARRNWSLRITRPCTSSSAAARPSKAARGYGWPKTSRTAHRTLSCSSRRDRRCRGPSRRTSRLTPTGRCPSWSAFSRTGFGRSWRTALAAGSRKDRRPRPSAPGLRATEANPSRSTKERSGGTLKDLLERVELARERVLPDPLRPEPEAGQHGAVQFALLRSHLAIRLARAQTQQRDLLQLLIDDPVFFDSEPLVLVAFLLVVALDAVGRDDLDSQVGRPANAAPLDQSQPLLADEKDVGLRTVVLVEPHRHPGAVDLSETAVGDEVVDQSAQPHEEVVRVRVLVRGTVAHSIRQVGTLV